MDEQQKKNNPVRIDLTKEQTEKIREQTGKDAASIEFTVEELEERIAPVTLDPGGFRAL